jgi:hypothetical protein
MPMKLMTMIGINDPNQLASGLETVTISNPDATVHSTSSAPSR